VATNVNPEADDVDRSIWKPVSLVELSVQLSRAEVVESVDALAAVGAAGWAATTIGKARAMIAPKIVLTGRQGCLDKNRNLSCEDLSFSNPQIANGFYKSPRNIRSEPKFRAGS